jgi:diketogulonate reductase-like aldo/keto reductase
MSSTAFSVKGQQGAIPSLGLGTATLFGGTCQQAVVEAIRQGYRHIDTALLYNNQEAVGAGIAEAIAAGLCTRADLFVTTKVGFYPAAADGRNCQVHIAVSGVFPSLRRRAAAPPPACPCAILAHPR